MVLMAGEMRLIRAEAPSWRGLVFLFKASTIMQMTYCHALRVCAYNTGCFQLLLVGVNLALGFFDVLLDLFDFQAVDCGH